jgi:translocation and assembly module TamB
MRRAILIALALVAATAALLAAFLISPAAKRLAGEIAERQIANTLGGEVEIGAVKGDLFRHFELQDLRFKDQSAEWAEIERVDIRWSSRKLLNRKIEIAEIIIGPARINKLPPKRGDREPFKGFELPERLPALSIGRIEIRDLVVNEAIVGEDVRLAGGATVEMRGSRFYVNAALKADDGLDDLKVLIDHDPADGRLVADARVNAKENGAIAALTGAGGPIEFWASGAGPPEEFVLTFAGAFGDAGSVAGQATGDIKALSSIDIALSANPGTRFSKWQADLGESIDFKAVFVPLERGGRLDIDNFRLASGVIVGKAEWRNAKTALQSGVVKLSASFADGWRPSLQAALGDRVEAQLALERRGEAFDLTAEASSPNLSFAARDGSTDLRSRFESEVEIRLARASSLAAPLRSAVNARADVLIARGDSLAFKNAEFISADGARLSGDARYDFLEPKIVASGTVSLSEPSLKQLVPSLQARGQFAAEFDAEGAPGDLILRVTATTPALAFGSSVLPPTRAAVSVAGLPSTPSGEIAIRAIDGSRRASANLARTADGLWRFSRIEFEGREFRARGGLEFNPDTREGVLDLAYLGGQGAEPWPGVIVEGEARASGGLSRSSKDNRLAIDVASFQTKSLTVDALQVVVGGPFEALSFTASATNLSATDRLRFKDFRLTGEAAINDDPTISFATASADYGGLPVRLARPAALTFGEEIAVRGLNLTIGDRGVAEFEGGFSKSQWKAKGSARDIELPGAASLSTLSLDLDTSRRPLATGAFDLSSAAAGTNSLSLPGSFVWDGRKLAVLAASESGVLDVNVALPLRLERENGLSLRFDGPLGGKARYRGKAESIALFMPAPLQSLEGSLEFSGSLGGDVANPRVDGTLQLRDGAYTEVASGLSVVDIDLDAVAERTVEASALRFKATASGAGQSRKSIAAAGVLDFHDGFDLTTTIDLDRAVFAGGAVERIEASGALTIAGKIGELLVDGDVDIHALTAELFTPPDLGLVEIDVIAFNSDGTARASGPAARRPGALRYKIRLSADDNVIVRGRGLNSEWRAATQIVGEGARPLVLGVMNLQRGDLEFSGRRFNLTRGGIGFDTIAPNDPTIDIRAERETREGVTVAVVVAGRSSALKVSLESTPQLANEDIMALVLFDKPADQLSAFESLQVADALAQLGGVGVFGGKGVAGAARDALGVDLLNLEIDEADSSSSLLTVGKYVTDGLFVSASQNARGENGSLRIEYEIGQSFSLQTELRQDGDQTISANWKKDF